MKTKKNSTLRWVTAAMAAAVVLSLASCAKEAAEPAPESRAVQLIFPDAPPAWTSEDGTRTVDLGHGMTEWAITDTISTYLRYRDGSNYDLQYKADTLMYGYTDLGWSSDSISLWPSDAGAQLDVSAYYIGKEKPGEWFTNVPVLASPTNNVPTPGYPVQLNFSHQTTRFEFKNIPKGMSIVMRGEGLQWIRLKEDYSELEKKAFGADGLPESYRIDMKTIAIDTTMYMPVDQNRLNVRFGLAPDGSDPTEWHDMNLDKKTHITDWNGQQLIIDLASLDPSRPGLPGEVDRHTQAFLDWAATKSGGLIGTSYTLRGDVDLSFCGDWEPFDLGTNVVFDGAGHTLRGLNVKTSASEAGLFSENKGTIKNLTVEGTVVGEYSGGSSGGITGYNNGVILNCRFRGSVRGGHSAGGLAGENMGLIAGCSYSGAMVKAAEYNAGGIVGLNGFSGMVAGCWSNIESIVATNVGGIFGLNQVDSHAYGSYYTTDSSWQGIGKDKNNADAPSDAGCAVFDPTVGYPTAEQLNAGLDAARQDPTHGSKIPTGMRWVDHPTAGQPPFVYLP